MAWRINSEYGEGFRTGGTARLSGKRQREGACAPLNSPREPRPNPLRQTDTDSGKLLSARKRDEKLGGLGVMVDNLAHRPVATTTLVAGSVKP